MTTLAYTPGNIIPATSRPGIDWYQVHEIFTAPQGEGRLVGELCTFIRLQGCTVGCKWCDSGPLSIKGETNGKTSNTWGNGGSRMLTSTIIAQVACNHVVITGGEPVLWNLDGLLNELHPTHFVQLETSGANGLKGDLLPDWITWSPKENLRYDAAIDIKMRANEVKWVVDDALEFKTVMDTLYWYHSAPNKKYRQNLTQAPRLMPYFVLMPEGCPPSDVNIQKCIEWLAQVPSEWQHLFSLGVRMQYYINTR